jgi:acyl transferase domain-containing protein
MANDSGQVALIGMSGRFPGAPNLKQFWANLVGGVESVSFFTEAELLASGLTADQFRARTFVPAKGALDGVTEFDAEAFDFSGREASLMDPQFRIFLETALVALEEAGYAGDHGLRTGVFAGAGANTYQEYLRAEPALLAQAGILQAVSVNQVDFLSAWVSYKLNLTGPSVTVQSACSTSLAAVHLAAQSLLNGECDLAIAGGVSVTLPQHSGYTYVEGGLLSRDGHCRAFDAKASGFVPGEGVGAVLLKRLADARAAGDTIRAIIKGTAINNDGSNKIGFTAPSQSGMAAAILEGIAISGVPCESIRLVEAHGTATTLGDPLEVAALTQAFRTQTDKKQFCAIGSVKSNIGHANAAAGIAGLIKATLALENGIIPPSLHCDQPNPVIAFHQTPFYVNSKAQSWPDDGLPRRAAVNSFGIGGTNVHAIIEQASPKEPSGSSRSDQLLLLSMKTRSAVDEATSRLAEYLESAQAAPLPDVCYTLATGRRTLEHCKAVLCEGAEDAIQALRGLRPERVVTGYDDSRRRKLNFLFPAQAAAYANATFELYRKETAFRDAMDRCAAIAALLHGQDLREVLYRNGNAPAHNPSSDTAALSRTITVAVQYSLAELLASWGLSAQAFLGYGAGALASSCAAGDLTIEEALSAALAESNERGESCELASDPVVAGRVDQFLEHSPESTGFASVGAGQCREALSSILKTPEQALVVLGEEQLGEVFGLREVTEDVVAVSALRPAADSMSDRQWLLRAVSKLWAASVPVDWQTYYAKEKRHRVPLPTYPFERRIYCVNSALTAGAATVSAPAGAVISRPAPANGSYRKPQNDLQQVISSIWAFYLGLEQVGIDENFFDLGGNSIIATRIVVAIRETLQVDLPLRVLLENPTVPGVSEALEKDALEWETDIHEIARVVREIQQLSAESVAQQLAGDSQAARPQ